MIEAFVVLIVIAIVMVIVFFAIELAFYKRMADKAKEYLQACEEIREEFIARRELSPILSDFQMLENNITRVKEILHEMDEKHLKIKHQMNGLHNPAINEEVVDD